MTSLQNFFPQQYFWHEMSKTTLDKCSSGWHLFVKRIWQNQTFLSFFPFTSDSEIRQTTESQPILQSRYSKKPGSWLNASCIIHFYNIACMSVPLALHFHRGVIVWCHRPCCAVHKKKYSSLPWALNTLFSWLISYSINPSGEAFLQNTPSFIFPTNSH